MEVLVNLEIADSRELSTPDPNLVSTLNVKANPKISDNTITNVCRFHIIFEGGCRCEDREILLGQKKRMLVANAGLSYSMLSYHLFPAAEAVSGIHQIRKKAVPVATCV